MNLQLFLRRENYCRWFWELYHRSLQRGPRGIRIRPSRAWMRTMLICPLWKDCPGSQGQGLRVVWFRRAKPKENSIQHGWEPIRLQKPIWWSVTTASLSKAWWLSVGSPKQAETMSTFNAAVGFMDSQTPGEATRLAKELSDLMLEFAVPKNLVTSVISKKSKILLVS